MAFCGGGLLLRLSVSATIYLLKIVNKYHLIENRVMQNTGRKPWSRSLRRYVVFFFHSEPSGQIDQPSNGDTFSTITVSGLLKREILYNYGTRKNVKKIRRFRLCTLMDKEAKLLQKLPILKHAVKVLIVKATNVSKVGCIARFYPRTIITTSFVQLRASVSTDCTTELGINGGIQKLSRLSFILIWEFPN